MILRSAVNKAAKGDLKAAAFVFRLRDAPEFANTDTIDQDSLSPDDQAMLDEMMRQFSETDKSDQSILSGSIDEESTMNECLADSDENQATPRNPVAEVDVDDG